MKDNSSIIGDTMLLHSLAQVSIKNHYTKSDKYQVIFTILFLIYIKPSNLTRGYAGFIDVILVSTVNEHGCNSPFLYLVQYTIFSLLVSKFLGDTFTAVYFLYGRDYVLVYTEGVF